MHLRRRFSLAAGGELTMRSYRRLLLNGASTDEPVQVAALSCCTSLSEVKSLHSHILESGLGSSTIVRTALLNMYTKFGSSLDAIRVFDDSNVVAWTCMISRAATTGTAITFFRRMLLAGIPPDRVAFVCVLNRCCSMDFLAEGRRLHWLLKQAQEEPEQDTLVQTAIVNMYNKCGSLDEARDAFWGMRRKDGIAWNVFLGIHINRGLWHKALDVFHRMVSDRVVCNHVTVLLVCKACASLKDLATGRLVHAQVAGAKALEGLPSVDNALLDMYGKCDSLEDAKLLFDMMPVKTEVSWNVLIATYAQKGQGILNEDNQQQQQDAQRWYLREAIKLFRRMQMEGFSPSEFTLGSVADAAAALGSLPLGKFIHACILESGQQGDIAICNVLIGMYAQCGSFASSRAVFEGMPRRDLISWNAMVAAYARHGHFDEALDLFLEMQHDGENKPDNVTFVNVFFACGHAGLVSQGCIYFGSMKLDFGLEPREEHWSCIVDILGRVGWIQLAEDFVLKVCPRSIACWRTFLGACHTLGDPQRGKRAMKHLLTDDAMDAAAYVAISNICNLR